MKTGAWRLPLEWPALSSGCIAAAALVLMPDCSLFRQPMRCPAKVSTLSTADRHARTGYGWAIVVRLIVKVGPRSCGGDKLHLSAAPRGPGSLEAIG
ncbi:hypothetical protein PHLGIDRAFT_143680 [Phlebiopsis gigantea 11061_1 CR5-6]|uniref:Uncharacterized protein n=1 Tax=Phlebiopsis gigantea (strain 11061_1 CR5-6) TaxID=745531 RepID=A0A0C3RW08_PHLG1|nr:hypothetical protein PHLGIDRAFT_143680 [Phlebiopsis gigantea 11061_1 CR5-6]